ncbi:MAG: aldolase/citrate lyase family protein, partial [Pseudomonadota bacterium]
MSFTLVEQCPARLNRSELAVPGSSLRFLEKAPGSAADVIFLDLEDAVAPDDKEQARKNIIQALNDMDWGGKTLSVRVNGLDTHYMYRDVVDVLEQAPGKLDLIMIPKVGTAADVYALDMLVTQIETATKARKRIGFELIIETALGMQNIDAIASASKRIESLHFGVADYAASTRARTVNIGGPNPDYAVLTDPDPGKKREIHWGDMWHYPIARLVVAARA